MTIYTSASRTTAHDICDGGKERTIAVLDLLGVGFHDKVSMQLILRVLGLSDTLFSFCEVTKDSKIEADKILRQFMAETAGLACRFLLLTRPEYQYHLAGANNMLNKKFRGLDRQAALDGHYQEIKALHETEAMAQNRHWLNVYMILCSRRPEYLQATHAGIALMDGADVVQMRPQIHARLLTTLAELLGKDPHFNRARDGERERIAREGLR